MSTCKQKTGFLSLKDCGNPASHVCALCHKPICNEHVHQYMDEGDMQELCQECYLIKIDEEEASEKGLQDEYERRRLYDYTGYSRGYVFYDDYDDYNESSFSSEDEAAFDDGDDVLADDAGGFDPDDFQDS